ncbi:MAG: hypothetical protein MUF18_11700 [Fimbriiglobus sp.]|nr:hypothetical protein [Fimbriiglobus sp.]
MRPSRPAAFAVLVGCSLSLGCLNTEQNRENDTLALGAEARSVLAGRQAAPARAVKPPAFDPSATGGSGITPATAFGRLTPSAGTGSKLGDFTGGLPAPQIGAAPPVTPPALTGVGYGEPRTDAGRTSMARTTPQPEPTPPSATPLSNPPPRLDPPATETPIRPVVNTDSPPPAAPIRPVLTEADRGPIPAPVMPPAPAPPPIPTGPAANEILPVAPNLAPVPSPVEAPIPSVQSAPKLPPPPPIRPQ